MVNHDCSPLSPVEIEFIAERIVSDWKKIVRLLHLPELEIDKVKEDHLRPSQQSIEALMIWSRSIETPCYCKVADVLKNAGRNDVIRQFEREYLSTGGRTSTKTLGVYNFTSVPHFVGRREEIKKIKDFLKVDQESCQLCVIVGLPGVGKTEILNEALKGLDRNKIVRPQFSTHTAKMWSTGDLLDCIINKWRIVINYNIRNEEDAFTVLNKKNEGVILVLEVANLKYDVTGLYKFIYKLLRNESNKLKIIITSCTHPPQKRVQSITVNLSELSRQDSLQLLKKMNSDLKPSHCEILFDSCGGNPFILREVMNKLKQKDVSQWENYIQSFRNSTDTDVISTVIATTEWKRDMVNLFDSLETKEKLVLSKLAAFDGNIPSQLFECLFDKAFVAILSHLCDSHSILKRVQNNSYHLSTPIKAFIIDHISEMGTDKEYEDAQRMRTEHCLTFLVSLARSFFSKSNERKLCVDRTASCEICEKECSCVHSKVCLNIFHKCKDVLLQSLCDGMKLVTHQHQAIETLAESASFLRHCLSHGEIMELINKIDSVVPLESLDEIISQAVMSANMVFFKYFDQRDRRRKLEFSINCLESHKDTLKPYQLKVLHKCKIKKLWMEAIYYKHPTMQSLLKLQEDYGREKTEDYSISGIIADVFCQEGDFVKAEKHRGEQVGQYFKRFGNHPMTANALYLLGKLQEKLKNKQKARKSYKNAKNMYKRLGIYGKGYVKCLVALGRLVKQSVEAEHYFVDVKSIIYELFSRSKSKRCKTYYKKMYLTILADISKDFSIRDDAAAHDTNLNCHNFDFDENIPIEHPVKDFQFPQLNLYRQASQTASESKDAEDSYNICHYVGMILIGIILFVVFPFFLYTYLSTEL